MSVSSINGSSSYSATQMAQQMFTDTDTDSNGSITLEELTAGAKKHGLTDTSKVQSLFTQIDTDNDGKITETELKTDMQKNKPDQQMASMKSAASGLNAEDIKSMFDEMQSSGKPSASEMAQKLLDEADTDGDGAISEDELSTNAASHGLSTDQAKEMFSRIDTDGDGSLTSTELTTDAENMQAQGPQGPPPPPPPPGDSSDSSDSSSSSSYSSSSSSTTSSLSSLSDEDKEKLQTLMDMVKQVLNQNGGNSSALKGMILDTSR